MSATPEKPTQRTYGMTAIAITSERITRPLFGRFGFASGALVADWPSIVGSAVAAHTLPMRIKFPPKQRSEGVLMIKVASSAFATELQHLEPLVLERINSHFGYRAVARLQLRHGPLPPRRTPPAPPPIPEADPRLAETLAGIEDPELKAVLELLGRHIKR